MDEVESTTEVMLAKYKDIVMTADTKTEDRTGKVKCERYWPEIDGSKITKGKFSIQLVSTKTKAARSHIPSTQGGLITEHQVRWNSLRITVTFHWQSKNVLKVNLLFIVADKMRIILSSHVPGRSTYVNAVPMSRWRYRMRNILCSLQRYTKLQQDQEVDMFTIVRQLQSRRPEMISSIQRLRDYDSREWESNEFE
uniref:Tyrosine-protein phosphatase domain-containing protein n=1 Tax=Magallana gigas TaxID=29159 RepID=K1S026_MAGGI